MVFTFFFPRRRDIIIMLDACGDASIENHTHVVVRKLFKFIYCVYRYVYMMYNVRTAVCNNNNSNNIMRGSKVIKPAAVL